MKGNFILAGIRTHFKPYAGKQRHVSLIESATRTLSE
jgi:hypothetical protein